MWTMVQCTTTKGLGLHHIQMKENHIWENITSKFVTICLVNGKVNLADIFTKETRILLILLSCMICLWVHIHQCDHLDFFFICLSFIHLRGLLILFQIHSEMLDNNLVVFELPLLSLLDYHVIVCASRFGGGCRWESGIWHLLDIGIDRINTL